MPFHNFLCEVSKRHATGVTSLRKPNRTALFWNLSILERYTSLGNSTPYLNTISKKKCNQATKEVM